MSEGEIELFFPKDAEYTLKVASESKVTLELYDLWNDRYEERKPLLENGVYHI